jgi:hypothetical protein
MLGRSTREVAIEEEQRRYRAARERVAAIRSFHVHLFTYVLVNLGLFLINLLTRNSGGGWWFYWPLLGWGIGLASHAFSVFGAYGLFGQDWEEKQVRRLMEKEEREQDRRAP